MPRLPSKWALLLLGAIGVTLLWTHVHGSFLIDECNYTVTVTGLRQGRLTVPGTENISPTRELLYFDPAAVARDDFTTPVASTVPPLWAVLALPFSLFGWTGLVALNVLSFLGCALVVFYYAGRHCSQRHTPYLAMGTFVLGGYCLEYAQGVWPQSLSLLLIMGGFVLASRARAGGPAWNALLSGVVMGLATGVRYPNLLLAFGVGLGLLVFAPRRLVASALFSLGFAGPMAACSVMNYLRHGWWNPVSKGPYYFHFVTSKKRVADYREPFHLFWARIVDFSSHPAIGFLHDTRRRGSGGYLLHQSLKKAVVQSCPWFLTSLLALLTAWRRSDTPGGVRQELRAMSLLVASMIGFYAWAGFWRRDGFCFNQRYFLELVPLGAVALAWAMDRVELKRWHVLAGCVVGLLVTAGLFGLSPYSTVRQLALLKLPVGLGFALAFVWIAAQRGWLRGSLSLLLGICLSWSLVVHLMDDVIGARKVRQNRGGAMAEVARVVPRDKPAAIITQFPSATSMCPMHLTHDVVVVNTVLDGRKHAPRLVRDFLAADRQVFIYKDRFFPDKELGRMIQNLPHKKVWQRGDRKIFKIWK